MESAVKKPGSKSETDKVKDQQRDRKGTTKVGVIKGICISEKRGTQKKEIPEAQILEDWGIEGDAHGGKWHRQISLLAVEKIEDFRAIVQLIVVTIEQPKLLSLIKKAVDYKSPEVSGLTTGTVGRTHINLGAIAVNVGQAQQLSAVVVVAHYLLSSFCFVTK